jgi:hypothetical protein
VALHNGCFSATASGAEGLERLEYVRIGDRWRGGSKCGGEESRVREQVNLTLGGMDGGERISADIHVRHVKRDGEPKRNTSVHIKYLWCVKVIVVCFVSDVRFAVTAVLFNHLKFQSFDIVRCLRVTRGRDTDVLMEVRCSNAYGNTGTDDIRVQKPTRGSVCLRASHNAYSWEVQFCALSTYKISRKNVKLRCTCRVNNATLGYVSLPWTTDEFIWSGIVIMEIVQFYLHDKCVDGYRDWWRCVNVLCK